ncbi:MAG: hypothetical protein AABY84_06065, partial [Candidatus Firestonebacteria bacterium]
MVNAQFLQCNRSDRKIMLSNMYHKNKTLFGPDRLYDHLEGLKNQIKSDIDMSADQLRANGNESIISFYKNKYCITPLTLYIDNKTAHDEETTIDVSRDPFRNLFGDSKCTTKGM